MEVRWHPVGRTERPAGSSDGTWRNRGGALVEMGLVRPAGKHRRDVGQEAEPHTPHIIAPDAGHYVQLDAPELVTRVVLNMLRYPRAAPGVR